MQKKATVITTNKVKKLTRHLARVSICNSCNTKKVFHQWKMDVGSRGKNSLVAVDEPNLQKEGLCSKRYDLPVAIPLTWDGHRRSDAATKTQFVKKAKFPRNASSTSEER